MNDTGRRLVTYLESAFQASVLSVPRAVCRNCHKQRVSHSSQLQASSCSRTGGTFLRYRKPGTDFKTLKNLFLFFKHFTESV